MTERGPSQEAGRGECGPGLGGGEQVEQAGESDEGDLHLADQVRRLAGGVEELAGGGDEDHDRTDADGAPGGERAADEEEHGGRHALDDAGEADEEEGTLAAPGRPVAPLVVGEEPLTPEGDAAAGPDGPSPRNTS
ncbi:hypothetical protein [Streptomyces cyaneofuscatus]|uniref:hypothetical protein n=1 Tax=Streptomyces cyaneofuscatus TaxID=66883 RepID=UPI003647EB80